MGHTIPTLLAGLLLSCAGSPPTEPAGSGPLESHSGELPVLDPPEEEPAWRAGDHVVLRLVLRDGEEVEERLVRLEVQGNAGGLHRRYTGTLVGEPVVFDVPLVDLAVDLYSPDGSLLAVDGVRVPASFLEEGFGRVGRQTLEGWPSPEVSTGQEPSGDRMRDVRSWLAISSLLEIVATSEELSPVFWNVAARPPFWRLLGGIDLSMADPGRRSRTVELDLPEPWGTRPGWTIPLAIDVNGRRGLELELEAVPPRPPLLITGGVVRLTASHPEKPREARLEVLVARRGTGQVLEWVVSVE